MKNKTIIKTAAAGFCLTLGVGLASAQFRSLSAARTVLNPITLQTVESGPAAVVIPTGAAAARPPFNPPDRSPFAPPDRGPF